MYSVNSVEEIQNLNPFIIIGAGGGGEKFSNLEGIETLGFVDDDTKKQNTKFCEFEVSGNLESLLEKTKAKSVAIMLPIGAEGSALKYAVKAIDNGKNVISSFRSLKLSENSSLLKLAKQKNVTIKEISPNLENVKKIMGTSPDKCCEVLPKIKYTPKAPVIFIGGTSQECGKRTTTRLLGKEAIKRGMNVGIVSTDEMGIEKPTDFNFRAGSLASMDVPTMIIGSIKYLEERKKPEIIFIEGQASLTEIGNPHPRGLSASILIGAAPDAVILCHRPNHPYRLPRGIKEEIKAIESLEPTKVIGLSVNLRNNGDENTLDKISSENDLPAVDVYTDVSQLLDVIIDYLGD